MLITDDYREMQRKLHENPGYGVASVTFAPLFADLIRQLGATEILDYGAGKGRFGETLRQHIGSGAGRRADATDLQWLQARFAERDRIYQGLATTVVDVDDRTPAEVVDLILAAVETRRP